MNTIRWTLILAGPLAVLAAAALRGGSEETAGPAKSRFSSTDPGATAATEPQASAEASTPPSQERRSARVEGYREAREAFWEGSVSGRVVSAEGPVANYAVRVEWVLAHQPDRGETARLKRAGARRDRDGTWWARAMALTDESGGFLVEGLPAVPLRVRAGGVIETAQVGGFVQLRIERP